MLLLLSACASAPETGRSQLLLIDQAQETQLGFKTFEQMKRKTPISRDRAQTAQLQRVGKRIAQLERLMPLALAEYDRNRRR